MSLYSQPQWIFLKLKRKAMRDCSTKCSSNGNSLKKWCCSLTLCGKKNNNAEELGFGIVCMYQKQTLKAPSGEASPMLTAELDYKLMQQAYLLIYSLFLCYTFPSLPATISLFNLPYLASFLSFLNKWNSLKCSRAFRFCFSTRTCLSNCVQKVKGRIFGIIYHFLYWQCMRGAGEGLNRAPWLVKSWKGSWVKGSIYIMWWERCVRQSQQDCVSVCGYLCGQGRKSSWVLICSTAHFSPSLYP